jgi:hypothetical protein
MAEDTKEMEKALDEMSSMHMGTGLCGMNMGGWSQPFEGEEDGLEAEEVRSDCKVMRRKKGSVLGSMYWSRVFKLH